MKSSSETAVRSSGSDRVLVIMAKAPRLGEVKTRLTRGAASSYGILQRQDGTFAQPGPHAGGHGKGTQAGHGQDPFSAEPSS